MHDFKVKLTNFTFYGGAPERRRPSFFSLSELGYGSYEFNDRRVRLCSSKRGSCYNQAEVWNYAIEVTSSKNFFAAVGSSDMRIRYNSKNIQILVSSYGAMKE